ncbi:hypothetical protein [Streptomyces sp. WP-1]|uniref:hypothetical protein n=1 Tax=Streptomyces sp. WP-1 TaxID=3041497 RepID=UPI0026480EBF|nr:hypothetical protein [Streptomyces sp. WP-1]WKE68485.1 hypothetical protein QHG49_05305 [Streptomyces sp. WP-1]
MQGAHVRLRHRQLIAAMSFGALQRSFVPTAGTSGNDVPAAGVLVEAGSLDPPGEFGDGCGEDGVNRARMLPPVAGAVMPCFFRAVSRSRSNGDVRPGRLTCLEVRGSRALTAAAPACVSLYPRSCISQEPCENI